MSLHSPGETVQLTHNTLTRLFTVFCFFFGEIPHAWKRKQFCWHYRLCSCGSEWAAVEMADRHDIMWPLGAGGISLYLGQHSELFTYVQLLWGLGILLPFNCKIQAEKNVISKPRSSVFPWKFLLLGKLHKHLVKLNLALLENSLFKPQVDCSLLVRIETETWTESINVM